MSATHSGRTSGQAAPRRRVEEAWTALQRRYAVGAAALAVLLLLLWAVGYGPGGRSPVDPAAPRPAAAPGAEAGAARDAGASPSSPASAETSAGTTSTPSSGGGDAPIAAPAPAPGGAGFAAADPAAPVPLPGAPVARLYFEQDQAWPIGTLGPRLAPVLARLKADPDRKALVSGFHDRHGSTERNVALAQKRAQAVRRALIREGVPAERILLARPQQSPGSGSDREARRVEVTIAR
jgi:outer membrane protein OmpA-like peptidoglycan-associated protein